MVSIPVLLQCTGGRATITTKTLKIFSTHQFIRKRSRFDVKRLDQPSNESNFEYRRVRKLPINPTEFGPLTNLPDYSFKDGRPTPFGVCQKKRIDKQKEMFETIKKLVSEVDHAVDKYKLELQATEDEKKAILSRKLKPKGNQLLKLEDEENKVMQQS